VDQIPASHPCTDWSSFCLCLLASLRLIGRWFGADMLLPCINKRNRPKADSTGTARIRTNSTGSEHLGQKGKIRSFRSVISCAEECAWKKPYVPLLGTDFPVFADFVTLVGGNRLSLRPHPKFRQLPLPNLAAWGGW
jgi:hypothetical protein